MSVYSLDSLENELVPILKIQDSSVDLCNGYESANETADELRESPCWRSAKNALIAASRSSSSSASSASFTSCPRLENSAAGKEIPRIPSAVAESMKHDKKLDNVLPRSSNRRPASYLELYRRRFGVERRLASPEGSGLSICGDSSDERRRGLLEAADEAASSSLRCSSLPRDDRSELSLYRRLLRSPCRHTDDDEKEVKESASFSFRPYTLQDYRNFRAASARLDRSLGPDRAAISARREGLARRRSYGDAVSAWNLQRITSCVKKSQTGSTRLTGSKSSQSFGATGLVAPEEITKDVSKRPVKASCRNQREKTPSVGLARKSKSVPPRKPRAAVVSAGKLEPNLQTLRARHFDEKQMIDQLVRRTMLV